MISEGNYKHVAKNDELRSLAAEDVIDSLEIAFAATSFCNTGRKVLSYECPFGVGYLNAILHTV